MAVTRKYPLDWPQGIERTEGHKRARSAFHSDKQLLTMYQGRNRLTSELYRLEVYDYVWTSDTPIRADGDPIIGRRAPGNPGVSVWFHWRGQEYVFACDRWDRLGDNLAAVAKHIEAIRGMERWGVGDTAQMFMGFSALPGGGVNVAPEFYWWDVLGVSPNALWEHVQLAYHKLGQIHHPDHGGDSGDMTRINAAYEEAKKIYGK